MSTDPQRTAAPRSPDPDGPDVVHIEQIGPIPIIEDDDPRYKADRVRRQIAAAAADAMHSPEELQQGLTNDDPDIRRRVVRRLIARGRDHPLTLPLLLVALESDPSPNVRGAIAGNL